MQKRKSPIAKNLIRNSISGMFSAIEIHNKPTMKYRYEMVVLLLLNSWELLLKGYLYKFHKDIKLIQKDGTTKPFENCVNIVNQKIGKDFNMINENLNVLYDYRNQVAHYYIGELDPIIFSLISKNVIFYSNFLKSHFKIDLSKDSDLILLPIGFKRPISPIDYISTESFNKKSSPEVKAFLQTIVTATKRLIDDNIDDTIFIDFSMNLINVNRIKNVDLIAGIDNAKSNNLIFTVNKESKKVVFSDEGEKINLTRNRAEASGPFYYEELTEGIFDEINNIIDANRILSKGNHQFMLGEALYYRIYSERQHVNFSIETFEMLARTGAMNFYGPFLYWLIKLPPTNIVNILIEIYDQSKSPNIHNLTKVLLILGNEALAIFSKLFEERYKNVAQKPDFYYTFLDQLRSKTSNPILKAIKASPSKVACENYNYGLLIKESSIPLNLLSQECLNVFKGQTNQRSLTRELDFIAYGQFFLNNRQIIEEIKNRPQLLTAPMPNTFESADCNSSARGKFVPVDRDEAHKTATGNSCKPLCATIKEKHYLN